MTTILDLPKKILQIILTEDGVSFKDIINFSFACKHINNMIENNDFWEEQFYKRWPRLQKRSVLINKSEISYKILVQARIDCTQLLYNDIKYSLYKRCNCRTSLTYFLKVFLNHSSNMRTSHPKEFSLLFPSNVLRSLSLYFILDDVMTICNNERKYMTDVIDID